MNKITGYIIGAVALVALVISLVGIGGNNQSSLEKKVDELGQMIVQISEQLGSSFGSSGTRFPHGISADSTSPSSGEVRGADFTVTDDLNVSGDTVVEEFTQGGGILATSTTATAGILTEAEMLTYDYIAFTANTGNSTLTLPATSTMTTLLPNAGDMRTWIFENATTTAATTLTITAGTGIDLQGASNAVDVLDGTEWAELTCIRKTNTDVMCIVNENEDAD